MKKREKLKPGYSVVWFGYGKTGCGSAVLSNPKNIGREYAFEIKRVYNDTDTLELIDDFNGVTIHRNQVLKVYKKKIKFSYYLVRKCSNIDHHSVMESKYKLPIDDGLLGQWLLCGNCGLVSKEIPIELNKTKIINVGDK